jgi:hypothetical protein
MRTLGSRCNAAHGRSEVYDKLLAGCAVQDTIISEAYDELAKHDSHVALVVQNHFAELSRLAKVTEKVRKGCMATIEKALEGEHAQRASTDSVLIEQRRPKRSRYSSEACRTQETGRSDERRPGLRPSLLDWVARSRANRTRRCSEPYAGERLARLVMHDSRQLLTSTALYCSPTSSADLLSPS